MSLVGPPTACQHCGQTLTIEHILLECTVLQQSRDEYYTVDSLRTLFETIPETCIIEFLREAGFYNLIWMARYPTQLYQISHQLTTFSSLIYLHYWTPPLEFAYRALAAMGEPHLWRTANMSRRTCVVVKQMQSNPIQLHLNDQQFHRLIKILYGMERQNFSQCFRSSFKSITFAYIHALIQLTYCFVGFLPYT